jgi:putative ABC transport system permease protein
VHDSVILKMLGATRRTLITAFTLEYFLIGLATALFGLAAGAGAAWFVVVNIMKLQWTFDPLVALATVAIALVLTIGFGLIGTWRVLGENSAPVLRNL